MMIAYRLIKEGYHAPWWYGYAWDCPDSRGTVFLPIPFNFLGGWGRRILFCLMRGPRDRLTEQIRDVMELEHSSGFVSGYKDGKRMAWEHLASMLKICKETGSSHLPEDFVKP
mgnify:CR=1 FL=1